MLENCNYLQEISIHIILLPSCTVKSKLKRHQQVGRWRKEIEREEQKAKLLLEEMAQGKPKCAECQQEFATKKTLYTHVRRVHKLKCAQTCEICGKVLKSKLILEYHMNAHLNLKPYQCSYCGKTFASRVTMDQHVLIHTGVKKYKCQLCGKAFTQKNGLKWHTRSHENGKLKNAAISASPQNDGSVSSSQLPSLVGPVPDFGSTNDGGGGVEPWNLKNTAMSATPQNDGGVSSLPLTLLVGPVPDFGSTGDGEGVEPGLTNTKPRGNESKICN